MDFPKKFPKICIQDFYIIFNSPQIVWQKCSEFLPLRSPFNTSVIVKGLNQGLSFSRGFDQFPSMFSCLFRAWRFLPRLSHLKRLLGCKTQYQYLENDSQMKPKLLSGNGANGHFGHGSNMSLWALSNTLQGRGQQRGRRAVSSFGNFCEVICGSLAALQLRREGQGLAECQVGGGHQQSMPKILPFWDVKSHFKSCWTPTCGIKWPLGGRSKE